MRKITCGLWLWGIPVKARHSWPWLQDKGVWEAPENLWVGEHCSQSCTSGRWVGLDPVGWRVRWCGGQQSLQAQKPLSRHFHEFKQELSPHVVPCISSHTYITDEGTASQTSVDTWILGLGSSFWLPPISPSVPYFSGFASWCLCGCGPLKLFFLGPSTLPRLTASENCPWIPGMQGHQAWIWPLALCHLYPEYLPVSCLLCVVGEQCSVRVWLEGSNKDWQVWRKVCRTPV